MFSFNSSSYLLKSLVVLLLMHNEIISECLRPQIWNNLGFARTVMLLLHTFIKMKRKNLHSLLIISQLGNNSYLNFIRIDQLNLAQLLRSIPENCQFKRRRNMHKPIYVNLSSEGICGNQYMYELQSL